YAAIPPAIGAPKKDITLAVHGSVSAVGIFPLPYSSILLRFSSWIFLAVRGCHRRLCCLRMLSIPFRAIVGQRATREQDCALWFNRLSLCRGVTMAHDTSQQSPADPVPVTLLVGFLGSGKTTLANRILSEQHDQRIAVIVNEFGDVGIDGQLIVGVEDNVIELSNGCLCCTVQGDLADTLRQLLVRRRQSVDAKPFERIVIEASGLASPGPVLQGLLVDPTLHAHVQVDGVITMAHAKHIVQQLAEHPEAPEQVAYADHIILNHCDQCAGDELAAAEAALHACNQHADIEQTTRAAVDVVC